MPLIPRRPFWNDIEQWFEKEWPEDWYETPRGLLKRFFEVPMIRVPRMDIYETADKIIAEVEVPGVDPKNIEVEVKDNVLRIEAKAREEKEEKGKDYYKKEMGTRYFKRAISLPKEVVAKEAQAEYTDGILKVSIPKVKPEKKEKEEKIKIKVKGAKNK